MNKTNLGIFIGQSRTRIVLGKAKYKVRNKHIPTDTATPADLKCAARILRSEEGEEITGLEKLYYDFCEKAYNMITSDPSMQGEHHPVGINFPDFYYEIIPNKMIIE